MDIIELNFSPAFYPGVIVALRWHFCMKLCLKVPASTASDMPRRSINPYAKYLAVNLSNQGFTWNEVKKLLRINFSNSSLHRWTHLLRRTGSVVRNPDEYKPLGPRRAIPLDIQQQLGKYLEDHTTAYLSEIQEWLLEKHNIVTCVSTIDHTLRKVMNISLKNHLVNSKWSDLKLSEYLSQVGTMPAEFMVFAGESSLTFNSHVFHYYS